MDDLDHRNPGCDGPNLARRTLCR